MAGVDATPTLPAGLVTAELAAALGMLTLVATWGRLALEAVP